MIDIKKKRTENKDREKKTENREQRMTLSLEGRIFLIYLIKPV